TNEIPGLGDNPADSSAAAVNKMATISGVFKSFLKKVTAKKNMEIGILKYWMPPHEALARPNNKPPTIAFIIAILGLCFIAEISKYKAKSAKNRPSGSDLNHPKLPRWIIAGVKAINNAENRPAVVP